MRALSWKQPFATAMLHGKIETRVWSTHYRGEVLICASKTPYSKEQIMGICGEVQFQRLNEMCNGSTAWFGHAIAVGELVDCRPMTIHDEDKCFVEYQNGLICHVYENVKAIYPFPWKGTQGWKTVDQETIKRISFL